MSRKCMGGATVEKNLGYVIKRESQLNTLAYTVIVALIALLGFLAFALLSDVQLPDLWVVRNEIFRTIFTGLLLMVILYMADQHARLRRELIAIHEDLEATTHDLRESLDRLSFAHHAAEVMTSLTADNGLEQVLHEALDRFGADSAALVADEVRLVSRDGVDDSDAHMIAEQSSIEAVRAGTPQSLLAGDGRTHALAVPLRVESKLSSVFCVWRRTGSFSDEDMAGLELVAHIVEMSLENRDLLERVRAQLLGTLMTLAELVGVRQPEYAEHSARVAEHAVSVGLSLGLSADEVSDLRIASILHDVGMLEVPAEVIGADRPLTVAEEMLVRRHATSGARIIQTAHLGERVRNAVLSHHERIDGSGYPLGLRGDAIPLAAKILGTCDAYVAMTSDRPHRPAMSARRALAEMRRDSGRLYDARVVSALEAVTGNTRQPGKSFGPELALLLEQVS